MEWRQKDHIEHHMHWIWRKGNYKALQMNKRISVLSYFTLIESSAIQLERPLIQLRIS